VPVERPGPWGEQGQGVSQGGTKKRTRDTAEAAPAPSQPPVKKKKVEDNISWSLDRFKQSEDVTSREDELMDEIMADSEHSGLMSRPDTPASVASNDTVKSDQTKKGLKKQKKKSLETKVESRTGRNMYLHLLELLRSEFKDRRDRQLRCLVVMHHERHLL